MFHNNNNNNNKWITYIDDWYANEDKMTYEIRNKFIQKIPNFELFLNRKYRFPALSCLYIEKNMLPCNIPLQKIKDELNIALTKSSYLNNFVRDNLINLLDYFQEYYSSPNIAIFKQTLNTQNINYIKKSERIPIYNYIIQRIDKFENHVSRLFDSDMRILKKVCQIVRSYPSVHGYCLKLNKFVIFYDGNLNKNKCINQIRQELSLNLDIKNYIIFQKEEPIEITYH